MCKEWFHRMCERVNANQYEKDNMDDWYAVNVQQESDYIDYVLNLNCSL